MIIINQLSLVVFFFGFDTYQLYFVCSLSQGSCMHCNAPIQGHDIVSLSVKCQSVYLYGLVIRLCCIGKATLLSDKADVVSCVGKCCVVCVCVCVCV